MVLANLFRPRQRRTTSSEQHSRALALQLTGITLYEQGQYAAAVPCLESALSLRTVLGDFHVEQNLLQWLGHCYWNLEQQQAAYCCYQEALTLAQALGDHLSALTLQVTLSSRFSEVAQASWPGC